MVAWTLEQKRHRRRYRRCVVVVVVVVGEPRGTIDDRDLIVLKVPFPFS